MSDLLERIRGWCCATELHPLGPFVLPISPSRFDETGHERGERINGMVECPGCGLCWPVIEEPDEWTQSTDGRWLISDWGPGTAQCIQCNRVFVDTFEGCFELKL